LQSTGAAASVADVAVSAALPSNGNANTLANKALYISALELRSFMRMSPLFYWKNSLRPFFGPYFVARRQKAWFLPAALARRAP
jgi:hypothetical protein